MWVGTPFILPSVFICRVFLVVCRVFFWPALSELDILLSVFFFFRVFSCLHTAKYLFAECMTRHSANMGFPVVLDETHSCVKQR